MLSILIPFLFSIFFHNIYILFFFNDTSTTEIYTLSLHDALPIFNISKIETRPGGAANVAQNIATLGGRSEEHTSELQSLRHLVCRLLLEKKKRQQRRRSKRSDSPSRGGR